MNVSPDILRKETVALIRRIDAQIDAATARCDMLQLATLINAKATAYNTLVLLQQKN